MRCGSKFQNTIASVTRALLLLLSAPAWAQSVVVYSEFARFGAAGRVASPSEPREILSPALVRNGFTSFQVVVGAEPNARWRLHVGQNPENAVRVTIYRESGRELEPADLPVDGEGLQIFWMDLWTAPNAPVQRIKVEPQLYVNGDWVTYPMEARVSEARLPDAPQIDPFCPFQKPASSHEVAALQFRNAAQDYALAAQLPEAERKRLLALCQGSSADGSPSEAYFQIRDVLFRAR